MLALECHQLKLILKLNQRRLFDYWRWLLTFVRLFSVGYVRLRSAGHWTADDGVAAQTGVASAASQDRYVALLHRILPQK